MRIERIFLGLHRSALACVSPAYEALRDEAARTNRASCGKQIVEPLTAKAVGKREVAIKCAEIGVGRDRRKLVNHDFRLRLSHVSQDRGGVECICDDWAGAHESDQVGLALAANHCYHRVPSRDEGWHQVLADRSCGSGEEDPHIWLTSAVC